MKLRALLPMLFLTACASTQRKCQRDIASDFGADWIVVQYKADGETMNCWQLKDVSIGNETHSDGIWWGNGFGHLVHVGGWYNRVQVKSSDWTGAAKEVGVDLTRCPGGHYLPPKTAEK